MLSSSFIGRLDSVEWNGGMGWNGMVEWNGTLVIQLVVTSL